MLRCRGIFLVAAFCWRTTIAQPTISFPINAQLPPIAIAGAEYTFLPSPATFASTTKLSYELLKAPAWLRIDKSSLALSGSPAISDQGNINFQIQASDAVGSVALDVTLIVVSSTSVGANKTAFQEQLQKLGNGHIQATTLLYPSKQFSFKFDFDVFTGTNTSTHYFALSGNNAPLPAWVNFDPLSLSLSGTTPSLITPQSSPEVFSFILSASNVPGFSQASHSFQLSVTNHMLYFEQTNFKIHVTSGMYADSGSLLSLLRRDGAMLDKSFLVNITSTPPEWLAFDTNDLRFTGVAPSSLKSEDFVLLVSDVENNVGSITIQVIASDSGNQTLTVRTRSGDFFNYSLQALDNPKARPVINTTDTAWLKYIDTNMTLQGYVPKFQSEKSIEINLENSGVSLPTILNIIVEADKSSNKTATAGTSTYSPNPHNSSSSRQDSSVGINSSALKIALPIVGAVLIMAVFLLLSFNSKRKRKDQGLQSAALNETYDSFQTPSEMTEHQNISQAPSSVLYSLPSSPPPQVDLAWQPRPLPGVRNGVNTVQQRRVESPETRSSWEDMLVEVATPRLDRTGTDRELTTSPLSTQDTESLLSGPAGSGNTIMQRKRPLSRATHFNGRRSGGLGHGTISMNASTMGQIPLSPLMESVSNASSTPVLPRRSILGFRKSSARRFDRSVSNQSKEEKGNHRFSDTSSSSRYDAPASDSQSDELSLPRQFSHQRRIAGSDPFSDSAWEDEEWATDKSANTSQHEHSRHTTEDREFNMDDLSSDHRQALQELYTSRGVLGNGILPNSHSYASRSAGNSLRFL